MTLDRLRPLADRMLDPFVAAADRLGMTPDSVSVIAFAFAVMASLVYAFGGLPVGDREPIQLMYLLGAVFVFVNGWLDLLDGALAREQGTSSAAGDLLDHVMDRYADVVIIAGLAAGSTQYLLGFLAVTGVLMTSYLGTQAQAVGLDRVYGGLVGRADRLAAIGGVTAAAAFYPDDVFGFTLVGWLLVFLAVVGHLTALQRFYSSLSALE